MKCHIVLAKPLKNPLDKVVPQTSHGSLEWDLPYYHCVLSHCLEQIMEGLPICKYWHGFPNWALDQLHCLQQEVGKAHCHGPHTCTSPVSITMNSQENKRQDGSKGNVSAFNRKLPTTTQNYPHSSSKLNSNSTLSNVSIGCKTGQWPSFCHTSELFKLSF